MVTSTGLTLLVAGFGAGPPAVSACAVHREAPTASIVTPSAAPTTMPYQPRVPLCRAMPAPALARPTPAASRPLVMTEGGSGGMRVLPSTDNSGGVHGQHPYQVRASAALYCQYVTVTALLKKTPPFGRFRLFSLPVPPAFRSV